MTQLAQSIHVHQSLTCPGTLFDVPQVEKLIDISKDIIQGKHVFDLAEEEIDFLLSLSLMKER